VRGANAQSAIFPICKLVVERGELVRGYEVSKGHYVRIEDAELEDLEAEANSSIDLREFSPLEKSTPIYFESSYYDDRIKRAHLFSKEGTLPTLICLPRYASTSF
jgi:non-homologous end joining protein Ku